MRRPQLLKLPILLVAFLASAAPAKSVREYLDSIDFNNYALMFNYYQSQSYYAGVDDFRIIYPIITSYEHSITTKDVYFVRDSYVGLRSVSDSGWKLGVVGKVQTLGYGADASPQLEGMESRSWSLQAGVVVGQRLGPLSLDLFASHDILSESKGWEANFKLAWPWEGERFAVVPQLDLTYQSSDLVNHYFGVLPNEARAGRPEYTPGSAWTWAPSVELLYRWHSKWYLRFSVGVDILPDEITNSPISGGDRPMAVNLGVAYDSGAFVAVEAANADTDNYIEASLGAFFVAASSEIHVAGSPPQSGGDLEGAQNLDKRNVAWPFTLTWKIGRLHRLDLRYLELHRNAAFSNSNGEQLNTALNTRVLRLAYAYSFFSDAQKEFAILGGVSSSRLEFSVAGGAEPVDVHTNNFLPVIGVLGRVSFSEKLSAEAFLEIFALDIHHKSGEMYDAALSGTYQLTPMVLVGVGYQFFRQDITSGDSSFPGDIKLDYRGPQAFLRMRF